jgi:hypothetical protein
MSASEALRRTLIWSAGGSAQPAFADIDEEVLLSALREHRLDTRIWHRLRNSDVAVSPRFRGEIEARHEGDLRRVAQHISLFGRLRDALRTVAGTGQVLAVKGFGLYALTGQQEHARHSNDLDVLGASAADVARAALTLISEGYHHHGEEHPYVFAHMRDIEVHTRYVITGFPAGEDQAAYDPAGHTGALWLPTAFTETSVGYADLARDSVTGQVGGVPLPGTEMAVLIRCAHIYVGYAMDPCPLPMATVRLDELAQVIDLTRHATFSPRRFRRIHEEFQADLVVGFVRSLCLEFFGLDPFAPERDEPASPAAVHGWFPQNLWWDGIGAGLPVSLGWNPRELIVRSPDVPDLVTMLGPMRVPVPADGPARVGLIGAAATPGARFIALNHHKELAFAEAEFEFLPHALRTVVRLPRTTDDEMSAIGVASRDSRVELFFKPREPVAEFSDWSVEQLPAGLVTSTARVEGERHILVLELPWRMFGYDDPPGRGEQVLVAVRARQQVRPWAEVTSGLLFPACLVRAE